MEALPLAVLAVLVVGFGLISERIQTTVLTPPMVFVALGLLVGAPMLGLVEIPAGGALVESVAELTLVLVLFTDASRIQLKLLRREHDVPVRLLALGLPMTMIAGALAAIALFPAMTVWEAAVLAIILAPTDAALGQAVVSSPQVPVRVRQALNVESGLNDGIALPVLLFAIAAAGMESGAGSAGSWLLFGLGQIVLGPATGVVVGYLGGRVVEWGARSGWMSKAFQELNALGLAVLAYAAAELIGGNGFLAAFSAGLTIGNASRAVCACLYEFAEAEGQLLTLLTFLIYGGAMVAPALASVDWRVLAYAAASLTLVRMLPVAVSVVGLRLQANTLVFLGWFGPRGIASILYALLVLGESGLAAREQLFAITMVTVFVSVIAHGVTAWPGARWYARHAERMRGTPGLAELQPVTEMPVRLPLRGV